MVDDLAVAKDLCLAVMKAGEMDQKKVEVKDACWAA